MRKRFYEIIEAADENDKWSSVYDGCMLFVIMVSIIPLCFKNQNIYFDMIDKITVMIFIIDYLLRWSTADYKFSKYKTRAFIIYPFSPMAVCYLAIGYIVAAGLIRFKVEPESSSA